MNSEPILVLGGTGHYGRHIVRHLLDKGEPVRVLSRNATRAREIIGDRPAIVAGDITSRESVVEALRGVRAVVIAVSAFAPKTIRQVKAVERDAVLMTLAETQKAGVSRIVYISVYAIAENLAQALRLQEGGIKAEIEASLAQSDLNWTVLGAAPSMEIFFAMIRGDAMMVPGGGPPALPTISPVDLGELAAQAALRDDLSGRRFRMAGPEALSFPQAAERISVVFGKTIRVRAIPLVFPRIASALTSPFTPFSDRILYVNRMLGFIKLLNSFPPEVAAQAPQAHQLLLDTFQYTPTTLEMEARRRLGAGQ